MRAQDLSDEERALLAERLTPKERLELAHRWSTWARPEQLPPPGVWSQWVILAGRGYGKALALDTAIPTPAGWTTVGALDVGCQLFDEHGEVCRVTFTTPIQHQRRCYRVRFDDGTSIVADAEHRWLTWTKAARKSHGRSTSPRVHQGVRTTEEIASTLMVRGEVNHSIAVAAPLIAKEASLPIDPYVLGVWLGDGNSMAAVLTCSVDDHEILEHLRARGCAIGASKRDPRSKATRQSMGVASTKRNPATGRMMANGSLHSKLDALGLLGNKHIPGAYLRASVEQRRALLAGLLDTDGSCSPTGSVEFCSMSDRLARGVLELARSLGFKPALYTGTATLDGLDCGTKYRVCFTPGVNVFMVSRKNARVGPGKAQRNRTRHRYIVGVDPVESVPVRCIQVDSPSHLFLAGESMVATHNTRTGAEYVKLGVEQGARRIALVGRTAADVRDTMVEGESGILAISHPLRRPVYEPSKRRLTWPSGAIATCYSADKPDQLRGPQHDRAWADELCAWRFLDAWDQLMLGLRLGSSPSVVVTTTPRPLKQLRALLALPSTVVTRGRTYDNLDNLAPTFREHILARYEGTRLGRQELEGEIIDDAEGALWKREMIDAHRVAVAPELRRVVVAVDPSGSKDGDQRADECGIGVAAVGVNGHFYVLDDASGHYSPATWGRRAVQEWQRWQADRIVVEGNFGGEMALQTIRTVRDDDDKPVGANAPLKLLHASRGKAARAEPIAALYEQGRVHHVGNLPELEDELCQWEPASGMRSPNRLDWLVWALTELSTGGSSATLSSASVASLSESLSRSSPWSD